MPEDESRTSTASLKIEDEMLHVPDSVEDAEPRSNMPGVVWHRGLESWEVRVDFKGHRCLHGYIKPRDDSSEEIDRARVIAETRLLELESRNRISTSPFKEVAVR